VRHPGRYSKPSWPPSTVRWPVAARACGAWNPWLGFGRKREPGGIVVYGLPEGLGPAPAKGNDGCVIVAASSD
jgi:hypothetical protein